MKTVALIVSVCLLLGSLGFLGYEYFQMRENLGERKEQIATLKQNIEVLEENLAYTEVLVSQLEDNLENTQSRLTTVKSELQKLRDGSRFELHDPTYNEVRNFIQEDETDENEYIKDEYVCVDFASDVNNNAQEEGIRTAFVDIRFESGAHAILAFQTVDRGLIYVEPQNDAIITTGLQAGQEYYKVLDKSTDVPIEGPTSDTIQRITLIW